MSVEEGSSGEEYSLQIDIDRRSDVIKGKGSRGRGKGRVKRRGGARGSDEHLDSGGGGGGGGDPKSGDVVWAKVMGFNFWPAKVSYLIRMYLL